VSYYNTEPVNVTARKRHCCSWCGERIEAGTVYLRRFCVGPDGPSTVKQHPECAQAEAHYYKETGEHEWDYGVFTRGCICESGDSGHGTYPTCISSLQAITG
jgi:hypothetical protein